MTFPKIPLLLLLALPLAAQDRALHLSQATLAASVIADVLSSRGLEERNPVLGRGEFRVGNQGAKALAITGGMIVVEELIVRKWPSSAKVFKWMNFAGAGVHGVVAAGNWRIGR